MTFVGSNRFVWWLRRFFWWHIDRTILIFTWRHQFIILKVFMSLVRIWDLFWNKIFLRLTWSCSERVFWGQGILFRVLVMVSWYKKLFFSSSVRTIRGFLISCWYITIEPNMRFHHGEHLRLWSPRMRQLVISNKRSPCESLPFISPFSILMMLTSWTKYLKYRLLITWIMSVSLEPRGVAGSDPLLSISSSSLGTMLSREHFSLSE